MKPVILLLFCSIFLIYCNNYRQKITKNDLERLNLKGKVHIVTELSYIPTWSPPTTLSLYKKLVAIYNKSGNEIENIDSTMDYWSDNRSKYDETGKLISTEYYNLKGNCTGKNQYKYDKAGKETENDLFDSNGKLNRRFLCIYDNNGSLIERKEIKPPDSIAGSVTYKYDKAGYNSETIAYNGTRVLKNRFKIKYDDEGNITESDYYSPTDGHAYQSSYKYDTFDDQGNWVSRSDFDNGKALLITKRKIEYYQ